MPHGLSLTFLEALSAGPLAWLTARVRSDHTLNLEIRDDQIQVYYRGGRLMHVRRRGEGYPSDFDERYFTAGRPGATVPADARDADGWLAAIPLLKQEMDVYFATKKAGNEREFEQNLVRENNFGGVARSTDYFACSMEYQSELGRFDVVAAHWPSNPACRRQADRLPLALIEIKYGDAAIDSGRSGLTEHFADFAALARDRARLDRLCAEMTTVFQQKHRLGLISGCTRAPVSLSGDQLHVVFVMANTDPEATPLARVLERMATDLLPLFPGGVWIGRASQFAAGLYHDHNMSVEEFRGVLATRGERCEAWNKKFNRRSG